MVSADLPEPSDPSGKEAARYPAICSPVRLGRLTLPHRILTGSMHLNLETGDADALAAFYAERARGGASLMITGGAAVSRVGAGGPEYALINEPGHWPRWRAVTDAVHAAGGLIGVQLFHAGRYAFEQSFGLRPVAPSGVYSRFSGCEPDAMTRQQIAATIDDFASAAARAVELGFDAVEIMASEGYLLNQFASPVTNLRTDGWGGSAARRRAFPTAVTAAVAEAAAGLPVLVRMSGADLVPDSSSPDDVDALAVAFARSGADAVDVGIGWHEARVPTVQSLVPHGAWVSVAARIKAALRRAGHTIPVIASNRINSAQQAEEILANGAVDMVSMARPFLADPALVQKSLSGREALVNTCIGCNEACIDRSLGSEPVSCLVNPRAGRELHFPMPDRPPPAAGTGPDAPATHVPGQGARHVGVIGAGPAGMEAARSLAAAGMRVTLWEAGPRIGGQFLLAAMVPGKADFGQTVRYFEHELARLGVRVELNTTVDSVDKVAGLDHVVVAAGVRPRTLTVRGLGAPAMVPVLDYPAAFAAAADLGRRVAVIGAGGIGVDLAHLLAARDEPGAGPATDTVATQRFLTRYCDEFAAPTQDSGRRAADNMPPPVGQETRSPEITIMRRGGKIGAGMGPTTRWAVVQDIRLSGVTTLTGVTYESLTPEGIRIRTPDGSRLVVADTVVVAAGQTPNTGPAELLADADVEHTVIGGALEATGLNAVAAFEQGLRAGTAIAERLTP